MSEAEIAYIRNKFKKHYEVASNAKALESTLVKRGKIINSDILAEKIAIEKSRIEEMHETQRLQSAGEIRNSLQKELEYTEQRETIARFELFELKRVHE